jgi:hypothetical protein
MTSKRNISTLNEAAANAKVIRPVMFARLDFDSGVQRFHTHIGPRDATHPVHGSETYLGVGDFGGITADLVESVSSSPQPLRIAISAVKSALIALALSDDYHGRDAELMFGFDDENGDLVDDPVILWSGFMDKVDIALGEQTAEMTLTCESRATRGFSASNLRFTDEDLQAAFTGDLAGEYIFRMPDLTIKLGDSTAPLGSPPLRGFAAPSSGSGEHR